jgi:hypothetical protein
MEVAKIMGYDNPTFSKDIGGYHFVFLGLSNKQMREDPNSDYIMKKALSKEDLEWLENDIAKNKLPSLVFIHHGLAEDEMKGNWWFEKVPSGALLHNRDEVKEILKNDKNLLAVFSGHQHWTKSIIENGITYHVVGSLTENINNDGKPDGIWFEVDIIGKELQITKHNIIL